jgi:hypothetical protein
VNYPRGRPQAGAGEAVGSKAPGAGGRSCGAGASYPRDADFAPATPRDDVMYVLIHCARTAPKTAVCQVSTEKPWPTLDPWPRSTITPLARCATGSRVAGAPAKVCRS